MSDMSQKFGDISRKALLGLTGVPQEGVRNVY